MCNVKIIKKSNTVIAKSPYHPDFPAEARKLGGKWNPALSAWIFDLRDFDAVAKVHMDIFGTDGNLSMATIDILIKIEKDAYTYDCIDFSFGRKIAQTRGRDNRPILGDNIIIREGGFFSGGSRKNPSLCVKSNTVLEIRDVPKNLLEKRGELLKNAEIEILEKKPEVNIAALIAEKERLIDRVCEINALLDREKGE